MDLAFSGKEDYLSFDLSKFEMSVPHSQDGRRAVSLADINLNCQRLVPAIETKSGDVVEVEFHTASANRVKFRSVKLNGSLVFSSLDREEHIFGGDESYILCNEYGAFAFKIEGKVCITDWGLSP